MTRLPVALACAAGIGLFAAAAAAHHGWGSYDASKTLTLDGTVAAVRVGNPHAEPRPRDAEKVWRVTLSPPARMANRGKPITEIKPGDRVIAVGYPNKGNPDEIRAERITHNGVTIELR